MSTATTQIPAAAVAANTELYRQLALRFARKRTRQEEGTDPVLDLFATRPVTEDEAQAEAAAMTADFSRILRAREGAEPYLALGCDLIEALDA